MARGKVRQYDLPMDEISRLYVTERWNSYRIAEKYGCSQPTVLVRLKEAGVSLRQAGNHAGRKRAHHLPSDELVNLYTVEKWSSKRLAANFGCSSPVILDRLREAGVKLRHHNDTKRGAPSPHRHKIDEAAAVAMYLSDANPSMTDVARAFKCPRTAIQRALNAHGIKRKTLSEIVTGKRSGSNNSNWRDDLTADERLTRRDMAAQAKWRVRVYERDGFACVCCGDGTGGNLNAHHLEAHNSRRDLRWEVSNGVTLCKSCHRCFHKQFGFGDNTAAQFAEFKAA